MAHLDLITLGGGVILTLSYIGLHNQYPGIESPYLSLWPNFAAGLLKVWLSVRLIDSLIKVRDRHHTVRAAIWSNLNYFRSMVQKLLPNYTNSVWWK
jgi:hypothetical protein